jgi:hypothetical protein
MRYYADPSLASTLSLKPFVIIRLSAAAPSPKFVFASGSLQHHLYP